MEGVAHLRLRLRTFQRKDERSSMSRQRPTSTPARNLRVAAIAIVAGCLIGAGLAATSASGARRDASRSKADAAAVEIIEIRSQLRHAHLREVDETMLQLFGVASDADVEAARDQRELVRAETSERLKVLGRGSGATAVEALFLHGLITTDGVDGVSDADPSVLFDTGRAAARDERPADEALSQEALALYDLMRTDAAALQVLNDALDAAYTLDKPEVPEILTAYVARSEPYILSDGGYLGPDGDAPLVDSYVYEPTAAVPHPGVQIVSDRLVASRLWAYDQWVVSWQDGVPGPAPITLDQLADEVDDVQADVEAVVDGALADARTKHENAQRVSSIKASVCLALSILLALGALAISGIAIRRRMVAMSHAVSRVTIDPLTGVGNRHQLELDTAAKIDDPAFGWHLIAAIDMDRFKLINDTWGHSAGDAVLIDVARRLGDVVAGWRGSASDIQGAVIRLGGDEFLLALHAKSPINQSIVAQQLDDIRTSRTSIPGGQSLELAFSYGLVTALGPSVLDDLIRAADLASYEQKAKRRSEREGDNPVVQHDSATPDVLTSER